jgi:hypothetical protein
MRPRCLLLVLLIVLALPASAQAVPIFALSQATPDAPSTGVTGLIQVADGGGESQLADTGGYKLAGTGVGPYVYTTAGNGTIKRFAGGYSTVASGVGTGVKSMTVTGRGLLLANVDRLQLVAGSAAVPALPEGNPTLPGGRLPAGDQWISITTQPDGRVLAWSFNDGWGKLYEIDLSSGAVTFQDYTGQGPNNPFLNNRNAFGAQSSTAPVPNSGGISSDGQGGAWVASAGIGDGTASTSSQVWYAPPGTVSFNMLTGSTGRNYPHIAATGDGRAYVTSGFSVSPPYEAEIDRLEPDGTATPVTQASGRLAHSGVSDIVVDRCYTTCAVAPPGTGGGGGGPTGKTASPLKSVPKTAKVTKAGLTFKLTCVTDCTVSASGKLVYAKAKKKKKKSKRASAAASTKLRTTKVKLKAGKSKTVVIKLSKGQRKAIKKAKKKKRKITANLKLKVTPKGAKATTRSLKLKVK